MAVSQSQQAPSWSGSGSVQTGVPKAGMSTGAKVAIGVGIGFLVLVGLAVIAGLSFFRSVAGSDEFQTVLDGTSSVGQTTVDYPIGSCFDHGADRGAISCSEPHTHEVFALSPWTSDTYPDYDEVWITVFCEEYFTDYVGFDYYESELFYDVALPSPAAWDSGDHDIRCIAYEPGATLTESIRGAAF